MRGRIREVVALGRGGERKGVRREGRRYSLGCRKGSERRLHLNGAYENTQYLDKKSSRRRKNSMENKGGKKPRSKGTPQISHPFGRTSKAPPPLWNSRRPPGPEARTRPSLAVQIALLSQCRPPIPGPSSHQGTRKQTRNTHHVLRSRRTPLLYRLPPLPKLSLQDEVFAEPRPT